MDHARSPERVALVALVITAVMAAVKIAIALATSSLALLSQALDTALDLVAIGLVFMAVRLAGKPADESHHYGHGKAENLVAFTQTLLLGVVVLWLVIEAARRLAGAETGPDVPWYAIAVLIASAIIDVVRARWLAATARAHNSDALRAGALNFATDVGTAVVALTSLVLVRAGTARADAIGAVIVSVAVAVAAYRLGKRSIDVLMDSAPRARLAAIEAAAAAAPGVSEGKSVV